MHLIKYALIGLLNTAIHWISFYLLEMALNNQAISNVIAFFISASFSYIFNAKYNFKTQLNIKKYILFIIFMACIAYLTGFIADIFNSHFVITLVSFSTISLILGFLFSKWYVFK